MKSREFWDALGVHNSYMLVERAAEEIPGLVPIYLAWSSNDGSRMNMGTLTGYYVVSPKFKTDPDAHWMDRGRKSFSTFKYGSDATFARHAALQEAKDWCNVKYGTAEWGKVTGFGWDHFPIEVVKWANKKVREGR